MIIELLYLLLLDAVIPHVAALSIGWQRQPIWGCIRPTFILHVLPVLMFLPHHQQPLCEDLHKSMDEESKSLRLTSLES
jgi:hypothetical protein